MRRCRLRVEPFSPRQLHRLCGGQGEGVLFAHPSRLLQRTHQICHRLGKPHKHVACARTLMLMYVSGVEWSEHAQTFDYVGVWRQSIGHGVSLVPHRHWTNRQLEKLPMHLSIDSYTLGTATKSGSHNMDGRAFSKSIIHTTNSQVRHHHPQRLFSCWSRTNMYIINLNLKPLQKSGGAKPDNSPRAACDPSSRPGRPRP